METKEWAARPQREAGTPSYTPAPAPAPAVRKPSTSVPVWAVGAAVAVGTLLALVAIPAWVPVLGASMVGTEPQAYWYLSRASAFVAFALLWVSMASGLMITNKMARVWPGAFTAFDLHQFTSLLGLGFGLFHGIVLIGNAYIPYSLADVLVPFAGSAYRPLWTGIGQVGLYVSALVSFTFYIRKQLGNRLWRLVHYLSYAAFAMSLLHGLFSGTDSGNMWVAGVYWLAALSLGGLTLHRAMAKVAK